eukprot:gene4709-9331_t
MVHVRAVHADENNSAYLDGVSVGKYTNWTAFIKGACKIISVASDDILGITISTTEDGDKIDVFSLDDILETDFLTIILNEKSSNDHTKTDLPASTNDSCLICLCSDRSVENNCSPEEEEYKSGIPEKNSIELILTTQFNPLCKKTLHTYPSDPKCIHQIRTYFQSKFGVNDAIFMSYSYYKAIPSENPIQPPSAITSPIQLINDHISIPVIPDTKIRIEISMIDDVIIPNSVLPKYIISYAQCTFKIKIGAYLSTCSSFKKKWLFYCNNEENANLLCSNGKEFNIHRYKMKAKIHLPVFIMKCQSQDPHEISIIQSKIQPTDIIIFFKNEYLYDLKYIPNEDDIESNIDENNSVLWSFECQNFLILKDIIENDIYTIQNFKFIVATYKIFVDEDSNIPPSPITESGTGTGLEAGPALGSMSSSTSYVSFLPPIKGTPPKETKSQSQSQSKLLYTSHDNATASASTSSTAATDSNFSKISEHIFQSSQLLYSGEISVNVVGHREILIIPYLEADKYPHPKISLFIPPQIDIHEFKVQILHFLGKNINENINIMEIYLSYLDNNLRIIDNNEILRNLMSGNEVVVDFKPKQSLSQSCSHSNDTTTTNDTNTTIEVYITVKNSYGQLISTSAAMKVDLPTNLNTTGQMYWIAELGDPVLQTGFIEEMEPFPDKQSHYAPSDYFHFKPECSDSDHSEYYHTSTSMCLISEANTIANEVEDKHMGKRTRTSTSTKNVLVSVTLDGIENEQKEIILTYDNRTTYDDIMQQLMTPWNELFHNHLEQQQQQQEEQQQDSHSHNKYIVLIFLGKPMAHIDNEVQVEVEDSNKNKNKNEEEMIQLDSWLKIKNIIQNKESDSISNINSNPIELRLQLENSFIIHFIIVADEEDLMWEYNQKFNNKYKPFIIDYNWTIEDFIHYLSVEINIPTGCVDNDNDNGYDFNGTGNGTEECKSDITTNTNNSNARSTTTTTPYFSSSNDNKNSNQNFKINREELTQSFRNIQMDIPPMAYLNKLCKEFDTIESAIIHYMEYPTAIVEEEDMDGIYTLPDQVSSPVSAATTTSTSNNTSTAIPYTKFNLELLLGFMNIGIEINDVHRNTLSQQSQIQSQSHTVPQPAIVTQRPPPLPLHLQDNPIAHELLEFGFEIRDIEKALKRCSSLEAAVEYISTHTSSQNGDDMTASTTSTRPELTFDCAICMDPQVSMSSAYIVSCKESHKYCTECILGHVKIIVLGDTSHLPACPGANNDQNRCNHILLNEELIQIANFEDDIEQSNRIKVISDSLYLAKGHRDNGHVRCIGCQGQNSDGFWFEVPADTDRTYVKCPRCNIEFCGCCNVSPYHFGCTCAEVVEYSRRWMEWITNGRDAYMEELARQGALYSSLVQQYAKRT